MRIIQKTKHTHKKTKQKKKKQKKKNKTKTKNKTKNQYVKVNPLNDIFPLNSYFYAKEMKEDSTKLRCY